MAARGWSERLGVDQHKGDTGGLVGAIASGVIGAALDQDLACLEQHLTFVH